ncbi:hypothetical protein J0383_07940 [Flavobacterium endoglycinae]|uniref:Uncharacterized protein n=1 Tax=Flavobacterium endoglycinae TaxID=2816357 RepID=A0ABX7QJ78_9FLAO|nr:hypothetical protein [Flavobacterium endoglycinae]QSW90730.1 hypothetical protein J0383_07940 [Flavobacterium endoglycinae]
MKNNKIQLGDSTMKAVVKMADGNYGAVTPLLELLESDHIDPDNALGGIGVLLFLDSLGIYGTDLYVLYSDICGQDIVKMIAVLRATQMGIFETWTLKDACSRQDFSGRDLVPVNELYEKVKERLPRFNS